MSDLASLLAKGARLYAAGQSATAAAVYREALALAPDDPTTRLRHALAIWHGENRGAEAIATIQELEAQHPQPTLHASAALVLNSLGRFEDAVIAARRAVTGDPGQTGAWLDLATATGPDKTAALLHEITALLTRDWPSEKARQLHFARALLLRRLGEYKAAFEATRHGNHLTRQRWDARQEQNFKNLLTSVFDPPTLARLADAGHPDRRMIFVVGMPRSGTTLLEQLLTAHPAIGSVGETPIIGNLFTQLRRGAKSADEVQARLTPEALNAIGAAALQGMEARLAEARSTRIIDKMPANHLFAPFIALTFPRAHILHMQRDPLDTCLSCWEASFAFGLDYAADLTSLGTAYRQYADLMATWQTRLGARIRPVQYEALVTDPEATLRPLIEDLGLPWDPACLAPSGTTPIKTASVAQARGAINTRSIGRWRQHEEALQPLIAALGDLPLDESRRKTRSS